MENTDSPLFIPMEAEIGSRQITYGRSQTTEQGNLRNLLERYVALNGIAR